MIYDLIAKNISELGEELQTTQNILLNLTKNHFFEEHQTRGAIKVIADELIESMQLRNDSNENK